MQENNTAPIHKPHYAFFVFISCCAITGISVSLYFSCGGIFYTPVSEYFGVGRGTYAIAGTIMSITLGVFSPIMGRWIKEHSLKRTLVAILSLQAATYIVQSMFTSVYFFYISGVIHGIVHSLLMVLVVPTIINRWFSVKRGFFIGFASSMSGVGGIILNPIAGAFLEAHGWQATFRLYGILIALIPLMFTIFVLRDYPEQKGLLPYGYEKVSHEKEFLSPDDEILKGIPYDSAKRTASFYAIAVVSVCVGILTCYASYLPSYATSLGLSVTFGAALASAMGVGILIGKNGTGILFDKNPQLGLFVSAMGPAFGFAVLFLGASFSGLLPVGSALFGFSYSASPVLIPLLVMHIFGARDQAQILGTINFYSSIIGAGATVLYGFVSDIPNGTGFFILLGLSFVMAVISWIAGVIALKKGKNIA